MLNSIQQFIDHGVPNLQKASKVFSEHPENFAEFLYTVKDQVLQLALDYVSENLSCFNQVVKDCPKRREQWDIVRTDDKELITSIGRLTFQRTLFRNKTTGETKYLVDEFLGREKHERLTEDAVAALLKESTDTSYQKGGDAASILDKVSKETVKDKIHALEFPTEQKRKGRKRKVEVLYIEADEDHVSLQFQNKKGDLQYSESGRKLNGAITKLVYVHEGIRKDAPKSTRHHLVNPHYFSGTYEGSQNNDLWDEVYAYIENNYEVENIKKIYLAADGGAWIKAGARRIGGLTYAIDEFHLRKYLIKMTNHMLDSADDARKMLCEAIKSGTKEDFLSLVDMLQDHAEKDSQKRQIEASAKYILDNWCAAKVRLQVRTIAGSSTEGHVSHVLSKRMSTQAMGWSKHGCDKMAHLRAYKWNKGSMLELVRYQKALRKKAAGAEEFSDVVAEAKEIMYSHPSWGKYVDAIQVEVSAEVRKWIGIGLHSYVWKLF